MSRRVWLFIALMTVATVCVAADKPSTTKTRPPIATIKNDKIVVNEAALRKTFLDGGAISSFEVVRLDNGYNLLRKGRSISGVFRTEVIPLVQSSSSLLLPKTFKVGWYVSCVGSGNCPDNWSCRVKPDRSGCQCSDGSGCQMDLGSGELFAEKIYI